MKPKGDVSRANMFVSIYSSLGALDVLLIIVVACGMRIPLALANLYVHTYKHTDTYVYTL